MLMNFIFKIVTESTGFTFDLSLVYIYTLIWQERYMVDSAFYTDEIVTTLLNQCHDVAQPLLFLLHGLNTDSNNYSKPAEFEVWGDWLIGFHFCIAVVLLGPYAIAGKFICIYSGD